MISNIKKENLVNYILQVLIFFTLFFIILYFLVGYFSIPFKYVEPMHDFKFFYENLVLKYYAVVNGFILTLLCTLVYKEIKISYTLFLGILLFTLTIFINMNFPSPMYYFAILNIYIFFYLFSKEKINYEMANINIFILILYTVTPIFIMILNPAFSNMIPPLFVFESFRGFTFDRIEYALLTGYLVLILIIEKKFFYFLPILAYGLLIAESRAVMVSLVIAIMFLFKKNIKVIMIIVFFGFLFTIMYIFLSNRSEIDTDGGRLEFYSHTLLQLFNNPRNLLFGYGVFYTPVEFFQVVPHNWFFQSLLNFGIVGTVVWSIFLFNLFKKLNDKGKVFIIYGLIVGFFHPGYDAFMFLPFSAFGYYLAIIYGRSRI